MGLPGEVIVGVALVPRLFTRNRNKHVHENGFSDGKAGDEEEGSPNANNDDEDGDGDGAVSDSGSVRGGFSLRRSATYMSFVNARKGLRRKRVKEEEDEDAATAPVNRWAPVFAGLCCPFSILLEIPGLTERWYIRTESGGGSGKIIETQPNPPILDVGLGVSMTFAVIANLSLIARFLEKKPKVSTLITIGALTSHDVINIIIVTVFGVVHSASDGFTYSQSFWMTVASSAISTACNVTLITDYLRVDDFKNKGSGLTAKQRSLVIACMALLCYLALGSICFSFLDSPHLNFQDSLYFAICTVSTVGFGDIVPNTTGAKLFLFPFDIGGIILMTVTIVMARESILESFKDSYRRRRERMLAKARERRQQKKLAHEAHLQGITPSPAVAGDEHGILNAPKRAAHWLSTHTPSADKPPNIWRRVKALFRKMLVKMRIMKEKEDFGPSLPRSDTNMSQESAFAKFTEELKDEERKEFLNRLGIASLLFISFWLVGSAVFSVTEGWSYFNGLYFSYVFFVSLGYGDYSPKSPAGRGFFIAWALFGIAVMTILLSVLTEGWQTNYKKAVTSANPGRRRFTRALTRTKTTDTTASATSTTTGKDLEKGDKAGAAAGVTGSPSTVTSPTASPLATSPTDLSTTTAAAAAAELEGDQPVKDMAQKLMEAAMGFSQHASYWMTQKKSSEAPAMLSRLFEQTQAFEDQEYAEELKRLAENAAEGDMQKMLFLISYTRSLEHLLETAQEPLKILKARETEVASLRKLTGEMETVLRDIRLHPTYAEGEPLAPTTSIVSDGTTAGPPSAADSTAALVRTPTNVLRQRAGSLLNKRVPSFIKTPTGADGEPTVEEADVDDKGEGSSQHNALGLFNSAVETLRSYPESESAHGHGHGHANGKRKKMIGFATAAGLVKWAHLPHHHESGSKHGSGTATPTQIEEGTSEAATAAKPPGRSLTFREPKDV